MNQRVLEKPESGNEVGRKDCSPLSSRQRELLAMPTIASQFPIKFKNGNKFVELDGECNICHQEIPHALLTGLVSRPIESVAVIEAIGVCPDCIVATQYDYRLHDDMRITGMREDGWKVWRGRKSLWQQMKEILGNLVA